MIGGLVDVEDGANMHEPERVGSLETGQTTTTPKKKNTKTQNANLTIRIATSVIKNNFDETFLITFD